MNVTPDQLRPEPDAAARFEDLRAIGVRSAARLQGQDTPTDRDLYDEDGLPG